MIFVSHGALRNLVSSQNVVVTAAGSILEKSSHVSHLPLLDFKYADEIHMARVPKTSWALAGEG